MAFLPREGLTLEAAFTALSWTLFEPFFTGPILLSLLFFPHQSQSLLGESLRGAFQSTALLTVLKALFVIGLLGRVNSILNRLVLNNFNRDVWNHGREIVVVTGGASGVGLALVTELAKSALAVIALDINQPLKPLPRNATFLKVDLADSRQIHQAASAIREKYGDPTILVNNAGTSNQRAILRETEEQIRRVFNVNTISHFLMVQEFLPAMVKKNHGHVVTVSSMACYAGQAVNIDYACSKAASLAFHEGLGQELKLVYGAPKIRTTIICPAYIRTPMINSRLADKRFKEFMIEPETVADAIIKHLHSASSGHLIMPARFTPAIGIRCLPWWFQGLIRTFHSNDPVTLELHQ